MRLSMLSPYGMGDLKTRGVKCPHLKSLVGIQVVSVNRHETPTIPLYILYWGLQLLGA